MAGAMKSTCKYCGSYFVNRDPVSKFCSEACANTWDEYEGEKAGRRPGRPETGFDKVAYQREYMRQRRQGMTTIEQQIAKLEIEIETRKLAIEELRRLQKEKDYLVSEPLSDEARAAIKKQLDG